jgi:cell wall-associated NlpC family hydrolase
VTNLELAAFCEKATEKKTLYMWGTYGRKITENLIANKQKQYSARYSEKRVKFLKNHIDGETLGCDCAGLIKWALWTKGNILLSPKYEAATDRGTNGLFREAKEKGKISSLPEIPGVLVWKDGHVGVYVGNGDVVECTLGTRGDGVVFSLLKKGGWTHWLKLPEIEYVEKTKPEQGTETTAPQPITNAKKKISLLKKLKKILIKH